MPDLAAALRTALGRLPEGQREVIVSEVLEALRYQPELLAIADAVEETQRPPRSSHLRILTRSAVVLAVGAAALSRCCSGRAAESERPSTVPAPRSATAA